MSARHPTPWRAEGKGIRDRLRCEYWAVLDRNGIFVTDALDETTAREVVDAVNRRTALAAVLLDMAKDCEAAWEGTPLRRALAKYVARLREIAGDDELPTACKFEEHERETKR